MGTAQRKEATLADFSGGSKSDNQRSRAEEPGQGEVGEVERKSLHDRNDVRHRMPQQVWKGPDDVLHRNTKVRPMFCQVQSGPSRLESRAEQGQDTNRNKVEFQGDQPGTEEVAPVNANKTNLHSTRFRSDETTKTKY